MIRFVDGKLDPTSLTKNQRLMFEALRRRSPQTTVELWKAAGLNRSVAAMTLGGLYARHLVESELKLVNSKWERVWHISPSVL